MTSPLVSSPRRAAARPAPVRGPRGGARLLALVAGVALVGLIGGCGLRLETPPPVAPTPDANEAARQRASADSLGLTVLAATRATDPADPVTAIRAAVVTQAADHLAQLGSGDISAPSTGPTSAATASPSGSAPPEPPGATADAVVTQLATGSATARADAATVPSGPLARLLGSVSTARLLVGRQLAAATGGEPPALPEVSVPTSAPSGPRAGALSALVADEDGAGYGYEVIAAKLSGDARARALARAAVHRARADAWASLLEIARPGLDPRRSAYALPGGLDDPGAAVALAQTLETSLATAYAALLVDTDPASRPALLDALAEATAAAVGWGAPIPAFPGMPERLSG